MANPPGISNLGPAQRSERARVAALTRWGGEDPRPSGPRGQAGLRAKFLRQVDEAAAERGETLTDDERHRRAECLWRAHLARIRFASMKSRKARRAAGGEV